MIASTRIALASWSAMALAVTGSVGHVWWQERNAMSAATVAEVVVPLRPNAVETGKKLEVLQAPPADAKKDPPPELPKDEAKPAPQITHVVRKPARAVSAGVNQTQIDAWMKELESAANGAIPPPISIGGR